jgi:hypothetical protein
MNGTAVKARTRDIRKAFGRDAVALVKAQYEGLTAHAQAIEALMAVVYGRGFFGRLRWLVTGT